MTKTQNTNPIVARYAEIVRQNETVDAVLAALYDRWDRAEIIWEMCDTAVDIGLGGDPTKDDAFDALFDRCRSLLPALERELRPVNP